VTRLRGWQQAALFTFAVCSALIACLLAVAAISSPWRTVNFGAGHLWLAVTLAALALAAAVFFGFVRRKDRLTRIVSGAVIAAGILGVVAVLLLAPETNPAVGVGLRVPLAFTSSAWLIVAGAAALARTFTGEAPADRTLGRSLAAIAVPVVLVLVMVFGVAPLWRSYTLAANERLSGPRGPVAANPRSALTGGVAWVSRSYNYRSDAFTSAIATPSGIAIARTVGTVDMLDPATGRLRWRYSRSDATGQPDLSLIDGGRRLLADFDGVGYLVLDAGTGQRTAAWPEGTRDHDIDNADPLLTEQTVSKGSDKLRGVDADGNDRWTFAPGRCTSISARATADTAVVSLNRSCGGADELVALDVRSGDKLWSRPDDSGSDLLVAGDLVVGLRDKELAGMQARSGDIKWRWEVPAALGCETKLAQADDKIVLLNCTAADKTKTVVTVINAGDGTVAWQQTAPISRDRPAITTDARVVTLKRSAAGPCELHVVEQTGYRTAVVPREIGCNLGVRAVGNQILARGEDSIIALS